MTRPGLTAVQWNLLSFIKAFVAQHGYSPSYDEMKDHLGYAAKSGMHRIVTALEERGHVVRMPGRGRSVAVVDHAAVMPGSVSRESQA